jgi:hypothetical protein
MRTAAIRTNWVVPVLGALEGNNLHGRLDPLLLEPPSASIRLVVNWDVVALHSKLLKPIKFN